MFLKNSLSTLGYITSLFCGGYFTYDYFLDKTVGDLLARLSWKCTKDKDFQQVFELVKNDPDFVKDISILTNSEMINGFKLLKDFCIKAYKFELSEENLKTNTKILH